jgi:hypothetical protein
MKKATVHPANQMQSLSANPERGREGWKELVKVAGIHNLQE